MKKTAITVRCPYCKTTTPYSPENIYRPFCSERCKTNDLGAWANETYKIEAEQMDELKNTEHQHFQSESKN